MTHQSLAEANVYDANLTNAVNVSDAVNLSDAVANVCDTVANVSVAVVKCDIWRGIGSTSVESKTNFVGLDR